MIAFSLGSPSTFWRTETMDFQTSQIIIVNRQVASGTLPVPGVSNPIILYPMPSWDARTIGLKIRPEGDVKERFSCA